MIISIFIKETIDAMAENKINMLFCNIGYSKTYTGNPFDKLEGGGSYNETHDDGGERYNFSPDNGFYYGFVENRGNNINLARIDGTRNQKDDFVNNVLVVFCANKGEGSIVVGWYNNATVYRTLQKREDGRIFYFKCRVADGVLLDENDRDFKIPRAKNKAFGFGFGQSQIWYGEAKKTELLEVCAQYKTRLLEFITKKNCVYEQYQIECDGSLTYEEGRKRIIESNQYERNQAARNKCIEHYGSKCMICGFDAGAKYGTEFSGKIEVHHIIPISQRGGEYKLDPIKDLIPVCPNCHMILHSGKNGELIPWQSLKEKLK